MKESFWSRLVYVLRVSRKPSSEELVINFKIVITGIIIMGVIGLIISLIFKLIQG